MLLHLLYPGHILIQKLKFHPLFLTTGGKSREWRAVLNFQFPASPEKELQREKNPSVSHSPVRTEGQVTRGLTSDCRILEQKWTIPAAHQ